MIFRRHKRTAAWLLGLAGLAVTLALVQVEDRAGGTFRLRPAARAELRAPTAAFLREIHCDEGDRVSPGATVARLEVPDLESRLLQQQAEVREARAQLRLLEIGTRPEEVAQQRERLTREQEAQRARLARLEEELRRLEELRGKLLVASAVGGVMTTPRLKEKVGQYVREGELIAVVEDPSVLEAEIPLAEQAVGRVRPGQAVKLKARALPLATFTVSVERIAPAATREEGQGGANEQSNFTVYCRLTEPPADLRPGMSGYARIYVGRRSMASVLLDRVRRYVRTEFWW